MMQWTEWQDLFYAKASEDHRLSPVHISLYYALLHEAAHPFAVPFYLRRTTVMQKAKISSATTMIKSLHELHAYGYIEYRPSFVKGQSMVRMVIER